MTCWCCQESPGEAATCAQCGRLQPVARDGDWFRLFDLPESLRLDPADLETRFHALSRLFHPDKYRLGPPRERMVAVENASRLNEAYRTLRDPVARATYLSREGDRSQEDSRSVAAARPPAALFEEILELQETMGEFRFAEGEERAGLAAQLQSARDRLRALRQRHLESLEGDLAERWDGAGLADRAPVAARIREVLAELSYLKRLLDSLDTLLDVEIVKDKR